MPANDYYDHGSFPSPSAPGASASLRAEFELVEAGFNKMPTLTGNGLKFVRVNSAGTAMEPVAAITGVTFDGIIGGTTPAAGTFTTLTSTGAATLNSLGVTGNVSAGGTLTITGTSAFTGNVTMAGNLAVSGALTGASMTAKANKAGETYSGAHDYSGATSVLVPTATLGGQAVNKTQLDATAFSAALPSQTGNAGKYVTTDGTNASWATITPPQVIREARTSNTILAAADNQKFIDITSGTFTQTFTAAATLGAGWWCRYRNSGGGRITIPSSDGVTNWVMLPNETRLFHTDGSAFYSMIETVCDATITSTEVLTKAPGYFEYEGLAWSAGASGQRNNNTGAASKGGGGGGCFYFRILASAMAATETITIGAGGAAVTTVADGNPGGNTTIGSLLTVYGGGSASITGSDYRYGGSVFVGAASASPDGYAAASSQASVAGCSSVWGGASSNATGAAASGNSIYGGGGGGSCDASAVARAGGTSTFGGNGGAAVSAANGTDGVAPAGGGGGTQTGTQSGAGARGEVRIRGIA